ncbi:hypothetical protein [Sorangium sp. So ce1024]|uniref:hypothetical protein n=1 Tax=Sorangium sp. So ce1024 TaxID=3133327 RepID=UPI003F040EF4
MSGPHHERDAGPPPSDDDEVAEIDALFAEAFERLDRINRLVSSRPPPQRDPAPTAPPG